MSKRKTKGGFANNFPPAATHGGHLPALKSKEGMSLPDNLTQQYLNCSYKGIVPKGQLAAKRRYFNNLR